MASIALDTKEWQDRLLIWGASPDGIVDPNTGLPDGVFGESTTAATIQIGEKLGLKRAQIAIAKLLDGRKVNIGPSEFVNKLLGPPPVPMPEDFVVENVVDSHVAAAKGFPADYRGSMALLAKRVAANVVRAPEYASSIAAFAKTGKATPEILETYRKWYRSATNLQKLLVMRLEKNPREMARFRKELAAAGADPALIIAALTKGPLAVAKLEGESTGLEIVWFLPVIAVLGAVAGVGTVWKAPDILKEWNNLQQESTNRELLEFKMKCIESGKCDPDDLETFLKHREELKKGASPWAWFLGGAAIVGTGLFLYSQKGRVRSAAARARALLPE